MTSLNANPLRVRCRLFDSRCSLLLALIEQIHSDDVVVMPDQLLSNLSEQDKSALLDRLSVNKSDENALSCAQVSTIGNERQLLELIPWMEEYLQKQPLSTHSMQSSDARRLGDAQRTRKLSDAQQMSDVMQSSDAQPSNPVSIQQLNDGSMSVRINVVMIMDICTDARTFGILMTLLQQVIQHAYPSSNAIKQPNTREQTVQVILWEVNYDRMDVNGMIVPCVSKAFAPELQQLNVTIEYYGHS